MTSASVTTLISDPRMAAADRAGNFGDGTNNTNSINFTLTNTSKVNALPEEFEGRYVRIRPNGSTMYYFFTTASGATIATPPAATDAGARAATQGEGPFADGEIIEVRVPHGATGETIHFARIGGTASQSVQITLADGTRGLTGP